MRRATTLLKLQIFQPTATRVDSRGTLHEVLNTKPWISILSGCMKTRAVMGNHYHRRTLVGFFLMSGRAEVVCVDVRTQRRGRATIRAGKGIVFNTWVSHAIRFTAPSSFLVLKSRRYTRRDPDTVHYPVL